MLKRTDCRRSYRLSVYYTNVYSSKTQLRLPDSEMDWFPLLQPWESRCPPSPMDPSWSGAPQWPRWQGEVKKPFQFHWAKKPAERDSTSKNGEITSKKIYRKLTKLSSQQDLFPHFNDFCLVMTLCKGLFFCFFRQVVQRRWLCDQWGGSDWIG